MLNRPLESSVIEPPRTRSKLLDEGLAPAIGTRELIWLDHEMEYRATLWYPSEKTAVTPIKYLGTFPARAVLHAMPYGEEYPLVLISHGFGGDRYDQAYLAEHLAARGYACLAPSYPDRIVSECWRYLLDRPRVFQMAYFQLLSSEMAARIDFSRVTLIAHSAGAYPSIVAAGATPRFSLEPVLEPALPFLDHFSPELYTVDGVQTIILMAPALSNLFDDAGLSGVNAHALIIAAEFENVHLLGTAQAYANLLPNARLKVLEGAGHYAFINEFPLLLAKLSPRAAGGDRCSRSILHTELLNLIDCQLSQLSTPVRGRAT